MLNDKHDKYATEYLGRYLDDEDLSDYRSLIESIKNANNTDLKYQMLTLLIEHKIEKSSVKHLRDQIENIYCSDKDIEEYLNKVVSFNPKLGYVSIHAKDRRNMRHDSTLDICVPINFDKTHDDSLESYYEHVTLVENRIKEVLRMILMETKTIKR